MGQSDARINKALKNRALTTGFVRAPEIRAPGHQSGFECFLRRLLRVKAGWLQFGVGMAAQNQESPVITFRKPQKPPRIFNARRHGTPFPRSARVGKRGPAPGYAG